MPRRSLLPPALLASALLLTACSGSSGTSDTAVPQAESTFARDSSAPAGQEEKLPVDETITDPVMGHEITVLNVVRDFPVAADSPMADKELVLVEVEAAAGTEFFTGLPTSGFRLTEPGEEVPAPSTTAVVDDMDGAGSTPYTDVDAGGIATGWLAFVLSRPGATGLELEYERPAAGVIGSDEQVEAEVFSVPLPDPGA